MHDKLCFQDLGAPLISAAIVMATLAIPVAAQSAPSHGNSITSNSEAAEIDQGLRLEAIGYRLAQANALQCDRPDMLTGLMLNNIGGYAEADRPVVMEVYNLTYGFGVLDVVPGSVADMAGLAPGDEIVAVNGSDLASFAKDSIRASASFDRTERFVDLLDETLRSGPARLDVRRGSGRISIQLQGAKGCGGRFAMLHRSSLNAWSDGRYVAVTDRMMDYVADDQELAFVVAHEMSHNILRHAERFRSLNRLLLQFGFGAGRLKASEIEADTLAVTLLARAGYDLEAPERLLRRTSKARWMDLPITHPGISRRIRIVKAAIARIPLLQPQDGLQTSLGKSGATAWMEGKTLTHASTGTQVTSAQH